EGAVDGGDGLVVVGGAVGEAHPHAAEALGGHGQAGAPEGARGQGHGGSSSVLVGRGWVGTGGGRSARGWGPAQGAQLPPEVAILYSIAPRADSSSVIRALTV